MSDYKKGFFWIELNEGEQTIAEYDDAWFFIGSEISFPRLPGDAKILGEVANDIDTSTEQNALLADVVCNEGEAEVAVCSCERILGSTQKEDGYYYCCICGSIVN